MLVTTNAIFSHKKFSNLFKNVRQLVFFAIQLRKIQTATQSKIENSTGLKVAGDETLHLGLYSKKGKQDEHYWGT